MSAAGWKERERRLEPHAWNRADGRGDGPLLADDDGRRHEQLGHVGGRELEQAAGTCRPAEADKGRTVGSQDDVVGVETPVDHMRLVERGELGPDRVEDGVVDGCRVDRRQGHAVHDALDEQRRARPALPGDHDPRDAHAARRVRAA